MVNESQTNITSDGQEVKGEDLSASAGAPATASPSLEPHPRPWFAVQSPVGGLDFPYWEIRTEDHYIRGESIATLCARENTGEDAQLIVQAVNSFEAMRKALEDLVEYAEAMHRTNLGMQDTLPESFQNMPDAEFDTGFAERIVAARAALSPEARP